MGFKIKRPSPPSVKSAVKAVKKAVPPSPAASAAKSLRQAGSSASQKTSQLARGAKRIAKTTGGKVGALAADGTRIRYGTEISRIGSRDRIRRINSRNTTTTRIIRPGAYTVRYRGGTRPNLPKTPIKRPPMPPGMVLKSMQATQSLIDRSGKSIDAVKNVSKAAKKAGDKVGALAAKGTKIPSGAEIRRIGSREQRRRINTRNRITAGKLRPGSYVVRDRALPSLPKSSSGPKLLDKAKKTFSNPGKAISKAAKSPKKSLAKKIKAASKAKVKFPKNVKGPKATCPLLKQNAASVKAPKFKGPKIKSPANKVAAGAVIGGAIGWAVGGPVGAVAGAAIGAGVGRLQELNKPKRINRRTPKKEPPYGGPQPIDKEIKRLQELASVPRNKRSTEQNAELCKLLGSIGPDPDFAAKDKENQDRLERSLKKLIKDDKEVVEANKDWSKLSDKQKSAVAEKILKAQRDAYNPTMSAPTFTTFNESSKTASDGNKYILNGDYNHSKNIIRLNTNETAKFGKNLESAADILCHEQAHRYQHVLVDMMNNGQITPSSPYYRQAQIWSANFDAYQSTSQGDSFKCYEGQAVERHSHVAEGAAHAAI